MKKNIKNFALLFMLSALLFPFIRVEADMISSFTGEEDSEMNVSDHNDTEKVRANGNVEGNMKFMMRHSMKGKVRVDATETKKTHTAIRLQTRDKKGNEKISFKPDFQVIAETAKKMRLGKGVNEMMQKVRFDNNFSLHDAMQSIRELKNEKKQELETQVREQIKMRVKKIAGENASVDFNEENGKEKLLIHKKTEAKLLGFIPISFDLELSIDENGKVEIKKPWYYFLTGGIKIPFLQKLSFFAEGKTQGSGSGSGSVKMQTQASVKAGA